MLYGRVLSIQSHVVHGYVGNKAAVFPLQLLGFEVDFVNSVQFSNHTQYKCFKGQRLTSNELDDLLSGLRTNQLLNNYTHLLTGYVGDKSFLNQLADIIAEIKAINPELIYLCDPVLGDNGKLYVPEELVDIYIQRILPMADIITPNMFELELIYGKPITSSKDVMAALAFCHQRGIKKVIVSSSKAFKDDAPADPTKLVMYASAQGESQIIRIEFSRLQGTYYGTGDAFASMVLAWLTILKGDLKAACEHTVSAMLHILKRTNEERSSNDQMIEMKLVESKRDIEQPQVVVSGQLVDRSIFE